MVWLAAAVLAMPALAQTGGFGGPSVLSRGTRPATRASGPPVTVTGSLMLAGTYSSGLTPVATDAQGNLFDDDSYGGSIGWNLIASKQGKRSTSYFSYSGGYQAYTSSKFLNYANQDARFAFSRQLTRRWQTYISLSAATYGSVLNNVKAPSTDELVAQLPRPELEIVDARYYALSAALGLSYQKSARLSFNMQAGAARQSRQSRALSSSQGYLGTGNMSYMLNRRQQIGVSVGYGTYFLRGGFGEASYVTTQFNYGRVLNPRWYFNVSGGVYQSDSTRERTVAVDPVIAQLTGQAFTVEAFRGKRKSGSGSANLSGRLRNNASVNFSYDRGISPGNGLYMMAEQETVMASVGFATRRRFRFDVGADWLKMKAITQQLEVASGYGGSANASYRIASFVHATGNVAFRNWEIGENTFSRNRFFASFGLSFSPGERPLLTF